MAYLGFDTSNYTTSVAVFEDGVVKETRKLLPVPEGSLGLRQSDAVFSHMKAISSLVKEIEIAGIKIEGVGASTKPREQEGSYMPCFLVGQTIGEIIAELLDVPFYSFAHQTGHILAALYGADRLDLVNESFVSLHISGGTTECVLIKDAVKSEVEIISETLDLNAGQLIDRVGGMLSLPFPSGKHLEELALKSDKKFNVKPTFKDNNPCISGAENQAKKLISEGASKEDVALFTITYVKEVVKKMALDAKKLTGAKTVVFAGGVMSNRIIANELAKNKGYVFTKPHCSSDNAIGVAVGTAILGGK